MSLEDHRPTLNKKPWYEPHNAIIFNHNGNLYVRYYQRERDRGKQMVCYDTLLLGDSFYTATGAPLLRVLIGEISAGGEFVEHRREKISRKWAKEITEHAKNNGRMFRCANKLHSADYCFIMRYVYNNLSLCYHFDSCPDDVHGTPKSMYTQTAVVFGDGVSRLSRLKVN